MHSDRLLPSQHFDPMRHHTGLVKSRLSIENNDITIAQMSVDLLIPAHWTGSTSTVNVALRSEELVGDCRSLLKSRAVLSVNQAVTKETY